MLPRGATLGLSRCDEVTRLLFEISLPSFRTLLFDSEEDVRNSGITLNGKMYEPSGKLDTTFVAMTDKLVDWDSDAGTTLQHCLLQSTNHINFCIGKLTLLVKR